jgi:hypothetical protein
MSEAIQNYHLGVLWVDADAPNRWFRGGSRLLRLQDYKVQVKLSLCSINYAPRHEDGFWSGGIAPQFLTSAQDGGEW